MKKNEVMGLVLGLVLFLICIPSVDAKMITMEELNNSINENAKEYEEWFNCRTELNEDDKILDVFVEDKKISFTYTDDYILYENTDIELSEDNMDMILAQALGVSLVSYSLSDLAYEGDLVLPEDIDIPNNYEENGYEMVTESKKYEEENGYTIISCVRKFKMSLDSEKRTAFMEKYGVPKTEIEEALIADLSVNDVTESSLKISFGVHKMNYSDKITDAKVDIYRSTDKDGEYTKINSEPIDCMDVFTDTNLESGTTYYYKVYVVGSWKYNTTEITTKEENEEKTETVVNNANSDKPEDEKKVEENPRGTVENPKTGISLPTISTLLGILVGVIGLKIIKKKNILRRI